jgi:CRP-like cAMP-binding protein
VDWPLLRHLSDEERRRVLSAGRRRRCAKREVIFHDGDPGDVMHLVSRGHVAIRVTTPLGDIATLRIVGPGEFFGELALVSPAPRHGSAVALDPVETLGLHRTHLDELRAHDPTVDRLLVVALATEVRRLAGQLLDARYAPTDTRVWRCLADLTDTFGDSDGSGAVMIPLTQDDVAQMVGATRPTVNRLLRSAADAGTLRLGRGRIEVLDREAVRTRAR